MSNVGNGNESLVTRNGIQGGPQTGGKESRDVRLATGAKINQPDSLIKQHTSLEGRTVESSPLNNSNLSLFGRLLKWILDVFLRLGRMNGESAQKFLTYFSIESKNEPAEPNTRSEDVAPEDATQKSQKNTKSIAESSQNLLRKLRANNNGELKRIIDEAKSSNNPEILTDVLGKLDSKDLLQLLKDRNGRHSWTNIIVEFLNENASADPRPILNRLNPSDLFQALQQEKQELLKALNTKAINTKAIEGNPKILTDVLNRLSSGDLLQILQGKWNSPLALLDFNSLTGLLNRLDYNDLLQVLQKDGDGPGILVNLSEKLSLKDLLPLLDNLGHDELLKVINEGHVKLDEGSSVSFVDAFLREIDKNSKILTDVLAKLDSANLLKVLQGNDGKILYYITNRGFAYAAGIFENLNPVDLKQALTADGNKLLNFVLDNGRKDPEKFISLISGLSHGALREVCGMNDSKGESVRERMFTILNGSTTGDQRITGIKDELTKALNPESSPVSAPGPRRLNSNAPLADFIAEFTNLGICETPKKAAELKALITQLHAKSPEMLAGILDNCQWI
ncbi:MAG: hypothetical protein LBQ23_00685, partial [Puniceicoccales bacterium]|nr:hypothetical protein [Puniceicoccales bacterium]